MIIKRQDGFTLVELMITMIIFLLAMTAASQMFVGLLGQFKQQSKIAETNIEGAVGLELLRFDIEQAGFGLPWDMDGITYVEAENGGVNDTTPWDDRILNDNNNPPRAIVTGAAAGLNGSDVLAIKATNVATNTAAQKWTYISRMGSGADIMKTWNSAQENLQPTDRVTVLHPIRAERHRVLLGVNYTRSSSTLTINDVANDITYKPNNDTPSCVIYGIAPAGTNLSMPFNRADYYIRRPNTIPARCEATTGVLYKGTLNHANGFHTELPLLDCVLDMQVVFALDTNNDSTADLFGDIPAGYTAEQIRDQVKEVRVYIVAQEGQMDTSYTYINPIPVASRPAGCLADNQLCIIDPNAGLLQNPAMVPDPNFRWKIYTLVSTPYNLK